MGEGIFCMMNQMITCCFTGHRPEKLPWGIEEADARCIALKKTLGETVASLYQDGMRNFLCGMARGCDMYFAEAVLALGKEDAALVAVIPYAEQSRAWPAGERLRWRRLVESAQERVLLQEEYSAGCFQRRNQYMVDHSALLLAVYDGTAGGTRQTIQYAMRRHVPFLDICP